MPQISKQIVKDLIATLDAYGCGAHHPDLLPLLDQPEGEPVEYQWQSPFSQGTWRNVVKSEFELLKKSDVVSSGVANVRALYTHPAPFTQLQAEVEALRKDAERYQWLSNYLISNETNEDDNIINAHSPIEFDCVIDAAIAKDTQKQ